MPASRNNHDSIPPSANGVPEKLVAKIVALSGADTWAEAKREWNLLDIFFEVSPASCACGHPITECCLIVNQLNGNEVVVGNVCVQRFIGLPSERLFVALRRISADMGASLNAEMVEHAYSEGWINSWEAKFYRDTKRIRKLTTRQRAIRVQINQKVLERCLWGEVCNA